MLQVKVWRGTEQGRFVDYEVPLAENQTVLDVVTYIQRHIDATLSYRFACRVGMCGSCAMTVNGAPRWTCRTHVRRVAARGRLEVAPLRNFKVVKDLGVEMNDFFAKWTHPGMFHGTAPAGAEFAVIRPDSAPRRHAEAGIECIGCGVCYAAFRRAF